MECLGPSNRRHRDWFDKKKGKSVLTTWCNSMYYPERHLKEHSQYHSTKAVWNARFLAEHKSWWHPRLCRQEWHEKLLPQSDQNLQSHQCQLFSASECRWNQVHIREQDPGEMGWAFRWYTKQAIFYQRQGHWTTAASPSKQVDVTPALG